MLLVARLAFLYRESLEFSLAVGLLFSLHPVHCEAVDSISGRSEILAFLFCLAALIVFVGLLRRLSLEDTAGPRQGDSNSPKNVFAPLATSAGFYALACLSKETGVVLPGILAVHLLVYMPHTSRERWLRSLSSQALLLAPFALVLVGYLILRIHANGQFEPSAPILGDASAWGRLQTAGAVSAQYLRLLILPSPLQVDFYYQQSIGIRSGASLDSVFGLSFGFGLLSFFMWRLWRLAIAKFQVRDSDSVSRIDGGSLVIVSLAFFFVYMLPVSHIFDIGALMAERFLFSPSIGFCLLIALAGTAIADRMHDRQVWATRGLALALILLCIMAGRSSFERAAQWRDVVSLWESSARVLDSDLRVHANLGQAYLQRGRLEEAESELLRALSMDSDHREALGNLALVQWRTDRFAEASKTYRRNSEAQSQRCHDVEQSGGDRGAPGPPCACGGLLRPGSPVQFESCIGSEESTSESRGVAESIVAEALRRSDSRTHGPKTCGAARRCRPPPESSIYEESPNSARQKTRSSIACSPRCFGTSRRSIRLKAPAWAQGHKPCPRNSRARISVPRAVLDEH